MKKNISIVLIIGLLFSIIAGCTQDQTPPVKETVTKTIKLFYGDNGNEKIVSEEREISYIKEEEKYKKALEELIEGPTTAGYQANISKATEAYGVIIQGTDIIVNLSKEFSQFGGSVGEIVGVLSLVNTLTQFEEINRVKILVEGEELIGPSGEPYSFISYNGDAEATIQSKEFFLYFSNPDALKVVGEPRQIEINIAETQEEIIKKVLEELIKGPTLANIYRTIPEEVKVLSVTIEGDIVHVDFSEEMHTKHWGGAAGEAMTISSIVSTLTEFENIKFVKMTVSGQPMSIEHAILEEPIERNEDMIEK